MTLGYDPLPLAKTLTLNFHSKPLLRLDYLVVALPWTGLIAVPCCRPLLHPSVSVTRGAVECPLPMSTSSRFSMAFFLGLLYIALWTEPSHASVRGRPWTQRTITDRSGLTSSEVFDETPISVKVISGTTAILPCSVDPTYTEMFVDTYQVVWVSPIQTVISLKDRRMINDMRISVERPFLKDWNLHIRNVSVKDSGQYKCQINTEPPRSKTVNLIVQVPPEIQHASSSEIKVVEGDNVELVCNATGIPPPTISWSRLNIHTDRKKEHVGTAGEMLRIHNISRMCDDTYECAASNSVPPAQSHSTRVNVLFPPEIRLLNTRIGQELGKETILECVITASPQGYTVWKRNGESLGTSWKYEVDVYNEGEGRVSLSLRIAHVDEDDYGTYTCVANNELGTASANMEVYQVFPLTTPTTTTTTVTTRMPERGRFIETPNRRGQEPADPYGYNEDLYGNSNNRRRPYIGAGVYGAGEVKYQGSGNRPFFLCFKSCHVCVLVYLVVLAAILNVL